MWRTNFKYLSIHTVCGYEKGNRPSFVEAARPETAIPLYESFNEGIRSRGITVATGQFGADMSVSLVNDGPVTIIIDSKNK